MRPFLPKLAVPASAIALLALGACADSAVIDSLALRRPDTQPLTSRLTAPASCDELLTRLKDEARAHVEVDAFTVYASRPTTENPGWGFADAGVVGVPSPGAPAGEGDSAGGPRSHSDTNTQVEGVDEADIVETDGESIFLLHGDELFVLDSWPPSETTVTTLIDVEGAARGLFVADAKAVVISEIYGYAYGYPYPSPLPGPAEDGGTAPPAPTFEGPRVKITVFDVSTTTPTVVSERWLEGSYVSARRHGDTVRVLVSHYSTFYGYGYGSYPTLYTDSGRPLDERDALEAVADWRDAELAAIEARTLADFLPAIEAREDGVIVSMPPDCTGYLLPEVGVAEGGMLNIATLSMNDPGAFDTTTIVGRADAVYANADTLIIAQNDYRWGEFTGLSTQEVAIHRFALSGADTTYTASGKTSGSVNGQFALDVSGDVLRVALTEERIVGPVPTDPAVGWVPTTPVSFVATLGVEGDRLVGLGRTPDLAPGERLQSVRFIGDRAYLVTFLQVDPLFVIDVSNAAAPTVLAELKIPGFSEYVHPLAPGYLLTIGREVDPNTLQDLGLALSIFDVRDDDTPLLAHKLVVGGNSNAAWDHHDFIFDDVNGVLAIPITDYVNGFTTELGLYRVDIATGLSELGRISHTSFFGDCVEDYGYPYYGCSYPANVRRGLFIDEYVYSMSYGGVLVHALADLETPLAAAPLPAPVAYYPYYPTWGGWEDTGTGL